MAAGESTISGKYLTVYLDGVELRSNYAWTAEEGGDVLDRTVGADLGYENEDMGVQNLHVTIKLYLDIATGEPSRVRRGTVLENLALYRNVEDAIAAYELPLALVVRRTQGGEIRGKMEVSCEVHSKGPYTDNDPIG
jgi:hypothetical protein